MKSFAGKYQSNKNSTVLTSTQQKQSDAKKPIHFLDNRPESVIQSQFQTLAQQKPAGNIASLKIKNRVSSRLSDHLPFQLKGDGIIQARWIDNGNGTAYWSGRKKPTQEDIDELNRKGLAQVDNELGVLTKFDNRSGGGGFYKKGGENRMVSIGGVNSLQKGTPFDPINADDSRSYFNGDLQVHHQGTGIERQTIGAPFPAAPVQDPVFSTPPQSEMGWLQQTLPSQSTERRPEAQIMGRSANEAIESGGLTPQPFSPWAHTRPDHSHPSDREDPTIRHPAYVGANQQHSAFESATSGFIRNYGAIGVGRSLTDPVPGGSGLQSQMEFSFQIPTSQDFLELRDSVPYFTNEGARSGDNMAIQKYLEIQYFKQLAKDAGAMEEDSDMDL